MDNSSKHKVSFVILHYMNSEVTQRCVNSILQNIKSEDYSVIIVDNGSTNMSGEILREKYALETRVSVIPSSENLGFAKGNNIGYVIAKDKYHADFIIVANNDVIFQDPYFIQKILLTYDENSCYLLGPDIVTSQGKHQNPFRARPLRYNEVKKKLWNRRIFLKYLDIKKTFHLENKIHLLEKLFDRQEGNLYGSNWEKFQNGVVLHGACVIYTPLYINKEDFAFVPVTFMYEEEDLLANLCQKKDYKVCYSPYIKVLHLEKQTTNDTLDSSIRDYFVNKNIENGLKHLLDEMSKD